MTASFSGYAGIVRVLVEANANVDLQDKVCHAISCLFTVTVQLLLQIPVQDGWTALHLTSQDGHANVVRVLIEANARVNQRSKVMWYVQVCSIHVVLVTLFQILAYCICVRLTCTLKLWDLDLGDCIRLQCYLCIYLGWPHSTVSSWQKWSRGCS